MSGRALEREARTQRDEDAAGTTYRKVSITLPESLLEQVRQRVGERGLSSYVAHALEHEERRVALDEWLRDMEDEHGPVPDDVMGEVRRAWPADAAET